MWHFEDQMLLKLWWYNSSKFQLWDCERVTSRLVIQGRTPFYNAGQEQGSLARVSHTIMERLIYTLQSALIIQQGREVYLLNSVQFDMMSSIYNGLIWIQHTLNWEANVYNSSDLLKSISLWLLTLYNNLEKL